MAPSGRASQSEKGGAIEKFLATAHAKAGAAPGKAKEHTESTTSNAQETNRGRKRGSRKRDVDGNQNEASTMEKKAKPAGDGKRKSGAATNYSVDECLVHVKRLGSMLQRGEDGTMLSLQELVETGIVVEKDLREVIDMRESEVVEKIQNMMLGIAQSIMAGSGFSFDVPSRGSANQVYIPELDRIVLKDKLSTRHFSSTSTVRKVTIMTRILQLVNQICSRGIHVTKRDLFYTDVKLFQGQDQSDTVLDDVSCLLGCTRSSLHVVASEKGVVVGKLQYNEDGDEIDCTRQGVGGKAIPPHIDKVSNLRSDALFVLLVEKDAAFMRLAEDRFYNRFPCIIITAKGQPDVATRLFLKKVKSELQIPVLGLVDSDPYGLKILSVYMSGSKNMAYDSSNLTTPDIKWLGVRPSDLNKYKIPTECRLPMTDADVRTGKELLKEDFITKNPEWVKELELMVSKREKAEIQALSSFGFHYLSEVYLPSKLKNGDWI